MSFKKDFPKHVKKCCRVQTVRFSLQEIKPNVLFANKCIAAESAHSLVCFKLQMCSGPKFVFAKFGKFLKNHLAANLILNVIWVRGWGKMAPGSARVSAPKRVRKRDAKLVR